MRLPSPSDYGTKALSAAMTFALAVALFALLGHWADGKLGTSPILLVVGFLLGTAGGMLHLLSRLAPEVLGGGRRRGQDRRDKADKEPPEAGGA